MGIVLVTGGTGFIGSRIAQQLVLAGHKVVIMSRDPNQAQANPAVTIRRGDVRDPVSLQSAMAGIDAVVCAVQFPNHPVENPRKGYTYMSIDGVGTTNQVAAAKAAGVKRFLYVSGAGTRTGQASPWFRAKLEAETAIRNSGIPYTIFRPSWVYGPADRSLNKFATFARYLPIMPVIGNGKGRIQPLFVDDLAQVVSASLTAEQAVNQTYDLGGPDTLTMDEIIRTMLQAMGKNLPLWHQPRWLMKLVAAPATLLPTPPLSPAAVDFILMEELVDNTALLRDFPMKLTSLSAGLAHLTASRRT